MSTARLKENASPTSSGATTPNPTNPTSSSPPHHIQPSYLPALSHAVTGFLRRLSSNDHHITTSNPGASDQQSSPRAATLPLSSTTSSMNGVYTPPQRTASPFHPPPLYPLNLKGYAESTASSAQLLTKAIAEEIRLLVPPRLQLCEDWNLVYSLEQDGVSLATLYSKCETLRGLRNGYVLVVRDGEGGLFGAYLTETPHPSSHYFGTGECFLWRASILRNHNNNPASLLQNLPPPPSADTTNLQRSTTLSSSRASASTSASNLALPTPATSFSGTGTSTPERIRFKAFPYSGVNDYLMFCETGFFSIGGGDGHYGLWLDDSLEKGISSSCLTFGNEPLSEEGEKFEILGVELWTIGSLR